MTATDGAPPGTPPGALKQELRYQIEIFALCGFAVAQPVLDVFGRHPEAFVFRGAGRAEVGLWGLAVTVVPWLLVGLVAALTRLGGATVRRYAQVGVLGVLAALIGLHVVKQTTGLRGPLLAVVAVALGAGFACLYQRFTQVGMWARYAAIAPVIFLVLFLVVAPTSTIVFPDDANAADVTSSKLPRHVVFLLFDEFPTASMVGQNAEIDATRFPNLARFAGDSTWYRNYTSVSGTTQFAVPSVLSGSLPRDDFATAATYPHNLFTLLGNAYEVHEGEVITSLCPQTICDEGTGGVSTLGKLTDDALDVWRQQISLNTSNRQLGAGFVEETQTDEAIVQSSGPKINVFDVLSENASSSPARLTDFIAGIETDKPTLEFVHLLLPHAPWHFYPSGLQYPHPDKDPGLHVFLTGRWDDAPRPAELGRQRHLLQVQYVDRLIGQVVAGLKQKGIYDQSLIVVTADHGAAFTPGEELRPGIENSNFPAETYDQIMWSPLLIKAAHQQRGVVSDVNVQSIDVLPTIADMVGITMPWKLDGKPVSKLGNSDQKTFVTSRVVAFKSISLGERFTTDASDGFQRMLAGNSRAFAPLSNSRWSFYKVGPNANLIGQRVDTLPVGTASTVDVKVDDAGAFDSVDPQSGSVPGLLIGNAPANTTIAVAVNGTLAGISPTFADDENGIRFAVIIPDFLFVKGKNDIQLFSVEGTGARAVLHPVAGP